jgi:peroxiredoxin
MSRRIVILVVIILNAVAGIAAETVISGKLAGGSGSTVRLMTYADQVTRLRKTLATQRIGEDETFRFTLELDQTIYAWIDIGFRKGELFLQPGQSYEVEIKADQQPIAASYYDRAYLSLEILRDDPDKLNLYIRDFNGVYNDFLLDYASNPGSRGSAGAFNSFKTAVGLRFKNAQNPYFLDYVKYKYASMELFLRMKSRDAIGMEYLAGSGPAYNNIEYMDFFHLFFEKYFFSGNRYFSYNKTFDLINGDAPLEAIRDSLSRDPVLVSGELRELVLVSGLKELYDVSGFNKSRILSLIRDLGEGGYTPGIREIASNLLTRLSRLRPGTVAPDFLLPAFDGRREYSLSDFKGNSVYLAFFDSRNPASQAELALVSEWYEDYENVRFVAVSVDSDPARIDGNPNISAEAWTILYYNHDMELLENYDAMAFPHFILIDDKGRIAICPAPGPSEDIRQVLDSI